MYFSYDLMHSYMKNLYPLKKITTRGWFSEKKYLLEYVTLKGI